MNQRVEFESFEQAVEFLALADARRRRVPASPKQRAAIHVEIHADGEVDSRVEQQGEASRGIDLDIYPGEILGITGRAGESDLIRTLSRLEEMSVGQLRVDGVDLALLSPEALAEQRRRIGMIFRHFNLLNSKTVLENLALPMKEGGVRDATIILQRARSLLRLVGLEAKENVYPPGLSGEQKQRAAIARALMLQPEILLCSEATSLLDPRGTQAILELLDDIRQKLGITVILVTHEIAVISEICDRVAIIHGGEIGERGPVAEVFQRPQHTVTRAVLAR